MSISTHRLQRSATPTPAGSTAGAILRIACGQTTAVTGPDQPVWLADNGFSGTTNTASTTNSIDRSGVTNPAPSSIYQSERWGSGAITYTLTGLTPGNPYGIRLHFAEVYYTSVGQRVMTITVNGTVQISNFDIFASAGGSNKAVVRQVTATANTGGTITLVVSASSSGNDPKICGIELSGNVTRDDTPANLTASPAATYVTLSWNAPVFPTGTVTGYNIYQGSTKLNSSPITATSYKPGQDSPALAATTQYTFTVKAVVGGVERSGGSVGVTTLAISTGPAWPLKVSANKRYITDQNNQAYYIAADTAWILTTRLGINDVRTYLDARKQNGFNSVCISLVDHTSGGVQPTRSATGQKMFNNNTIANPNPAFFDYVDQVLAEARSRDMLMIVWPMWLQMAYSGSTSDPTFTEQNVQIYGDYIGTRYKNTGNIIWAVGGDCGGPNDGGDFPAQPVIRALANAIKSKDPNHLMTYHPGLNLSSSLGYNNDTWLDFNGTYWDFNFSNMASSYKNVYRDYDTTPTRPVLLLESAYEGPHPGDANPNILTAKTSRIQSYYMFLAGGAGFTYGANSTYDMARTDPRTWQQTLTIPGAYHQGYVAKLFTACDWWTLVPARGTTLIQSGGGTYGQQDYVTAGLSNDGRLAVLYMPTSRSITIDMSKMSGPTQARWYDPTSGVYTNASATALTNTGTYTFTPSGNNAAGDNDWALILKS